jgi:hypothetical protein
MVGTVLLPSRQHPFNTFPFVSGENEHGERDVHRAGTADFLGVYFRLRSGGQLDRIRDAPHQLSYYVYTPHLSSLSRSSSIAYT